VHAAPEITLPPRAQDAAAGSVIASRLRPLTLAQREREIQNEIARGNVPDFWRRFREVKISGRIGERDRAVTIYVAPDYLALGSDADYFLTPLSPMAAQGVAQTIGCMLPTTQMVDAIYRAAEVKLEPVRIPPSEAMTSMSVFEQHNAAVRAQRMGLLAAHPLGSLVAGHKKDVVITRQLVSRTGKVAIYGWHDGNGRPIQPLYVGHRATWVDYSHGIRFIHRDGLLDGVSTPLATILRDPLLASLLSDEGPLTDEMIAPTETTADARENVTEIPVDPDVRISLRAPASGAFDASKPVRLVVYALPNGNTIEQTWGRRVRPGDDWHFDIQHIAAQTRWLRARLRDANLVVACVEAAGCSWPDWRRKHGDVRIGEIVEALRNRFAPTEVKVVLAGHSGGGTFLFGFLNAHDAIPMQIERIAFLDSNYGYLPALGHGAKLAAWLAASPAHYLTVFAYRDDVVRLAGKPIVSAEGGTWARSRMMEADLAPTFPFTTTQEGEFERHTALDGRVTILLHPNPRAEILHTRLVERNGFIHALCAGTPANQGEYTFFGERVYESDIEE
jgi:hypothetical protein